MKSIILRWALNIGIALVALGTLVGISMLVVAAIRGEQLPTTLAMALDPAVAHQIVVRGDGTPVGALAIDHATLTIRAGGLGYALAQGIDILAGGGLLILALVSLRRLTVRIAEGNPFHDGNASCLRIAGGALIALSLWTWVSAILMPFALLPGIAVADGGFALLPAISTRVAGATAARVDVHLDIAWLMGGLFLLLLAEAFRTGRDLRLDSEAIL
jgi:hypothetical protein